MARRTLIAHELRFHEKYRQDARSFDPCNLGGSNLLDIFKNWCDTAEREALCDEKLNVWLNVESTERYSDHIVLAELAVGKWGEEGKLLESQTGETVTNIDEGQAATGSTRAALFVPPRGEAALFFSEGSNRGCGGSKLLPKFASYYSKLSNEITMTRDRIIDSEALLEQMARVKEIELRMYTAPSDVADSFAETFGYVSHTIHSKKRSAGFPAGLFNMLKDDPIRASRYVGIRADDSANAEVLVTLQVGDKTKKISLSEPDDGFYYREVLNDWGEPPLDKHDFVSRCTEKAIDCLARAGLEWKEEWSGS